MQLADRCGSALSGGLTSSAAGSMYALRCDSIRAVNNHCAVNVVHVVWTDSEYRRQAILLPVTVAC